MYLLGLLPSLITGITMYYFQRRQNKKDKEMLNIAEARRQDTKLALEMSFAHSKLTYACAMAIKRGKANGEVEEGVEAFEEAKGKYLKFLNEQATEHLQR